MTESASLIGLGLAGYFQGFQIEDDHLSLSAVGDESAAKFAGQSHSVILFQAADIADHAAGIGVNYFHFRAVRQVDAPRRRNRQ